MTPAAPRMNNDLETHSTTTHARVVFPAEGREEDDEPGQARDERLQVMHRLEPGPGEVGDPPPGDPKWERYEPISKTKLRRRVISHEKLHGFVEDRFLLSSSILYSLCPPPPPKRRGEKHKPDLNLRDGDYDIPIEGDWLIMGVLAEKGPLMECTKFGGSRVHSQDVAEEGKSENQWKSERVEDNKKTGGGKDKSVDDDDRLEDEEEAVTSEMVRYMTVKLVNFSADSDSLSGDSTMLMTVFEADKNWRDAEGKQHFSGGSGGAFEMLQREQTGALLCLLNPKVRIARGDQRHFMDGVNHDEGYQMLCLKPMAASSVVVVGYAADYGECDALRKNGTRCGSFLDRRKGARACAFHTALQLERTKGGRQEFANSASTTFQQQKWRETSATSGFGLADGLGGGSWHSKKFVSYGRGPPLSTNDPGSSAFDVASSYGRDRQRREAGARKQEQQLDRLLSSSLGKTRTNPQKRPRLDLSDVKLEEMDRASSVGGKALLEAQRILNGVGPASSGSATQLPTTSQQKKSAFQLGAETIKKLGYDPFQQPSSSQQKASIGGSSSSQDASSRVSLPCLPLELIS